MNALAALQYLTLYYAVLSPVQGLRTGFLGIPLSVIHFPSEDLISTVR